MTIEILKVEPSDTPGFLVVHLRVVVDSVPFYKIILVPLPR